MIMKSLPLILFFLFTFFSFNPLFSLASKPSYKDHCGSIIPETPPTIKLKSNSFPLSDKNTGDYIGGDSIINVDVSWNKFSLYFPPRNTYATSHPHIFKIAATISFRSTIDDSHFQRGYLTFKLDGFWSQSSGNVCMVGKSKGVSKKGDSLNLDVVFKLNNVFNSSNITSLISGSLESLSSEKGDEKNHYFEPISLMMFSKANYNYSLDSKEVENEFSFDSDDDEEGLSLNFDSMSFCSYPLSRAIKRLQLEYTDECNSSKNCAIISGSSSDQLPSQISLKAIECSPHAKKHRIRVLVEFSNSVDYYWNRHNQSFKTKTKLIGEGWWDEKKNMLCLVLCHFTGKSTSTSSSLDGTRVGDCSIRLRLRFPSIWSIENTSSVDGQIWSNKSDSDQNYFKMITFKNDYDYLGVGGQDLKYEYSQLEKVKQSCSTQKVVENKGESYPDAYSYDMRFDMSVRESKKKVAWGSSSPLFVDDQYQSSSFVSFSRSEFDTGILNNINGGLFNISYKISLSAMSSSPFDKNSLFNMSYYYSVKILAEGVYDSRDGTLCMVGCRNLVSNNGTPTTERSLDCEVLMKFQFPSLDTKGKSHIKGSIESMRQKSDPLYFKQLEVSAVAYYIQEARRNVCRLDIEVIMALVSTTLACIFIGLQLHHVKRNPNVLPFISIFMMSILTLGHMIPLVLNFEALLARNPNDKAFVLGYVEKWLEVNEISVRLITMVAFLLQFRLLYITWSSRKTNESGNNLWIAEKKASYVTFPLYAAGLLIALLLKLKKDRDSVTSAYHGYQQHDSSWENIKSYGGLVLDGFLVPQVILNLFSNMNENVLSFSFYFGTTFVRLLPHAYDLYRTHNYADEDSNSYYYADPSQDFYSTSWDIFIPLVGIVFAIIIYLQQRFGAQCVLPRKFKGSKGYAKVPESEGEVETTNL
ncbi:hypothetical protein L195_g013200 [Trifolium pratense]|uniref:RING-type E3 ubiquitin transferase n=1 Tax=Trifolium pratense TaxID=57577 RepID=A0A2K3PMG2_TRIPR|nr:hypothetical protein L195_g013200 [Trifolium pratense]